MSGFAAARRLTLRLARLVGASLVLGSALHLWVPETLATPVPETLAT
jgi:hypothetical protein